LQKRIKSDHKDLPAARFFGPVFPEVIHTVTSSLTASVHDRFDEDRIQIKITIDTLYQVVALRAYSLCKPIKTLEIRDNSCGSFSLSTGFPQALWRALFAEIEQRKALDFPTAFERARNMQKAS